MLTTIFWSVFIVALLDTIIGNLIFPGRVGVECADYYSDDHRNLCKEGPYYMYKYNRIFLIPFKMYYIYNRLTPRNIASFASKSSANRYDNLSDAINMAKIFCNMTECDNRKLMWDSRTYKKEVKQKKVLKKKERKEINSDEVSTLLLKLGDAIRDEDLDQVEKISAELRKL